jgi:signal peptidase I
VGAVRVVALWVVGLFLCVPLVLFLIVVGLVLGGVLHDYRVPTAAMGTTLGGRGDHVLAVRYLFSGPGRSDIVAVHAPASAACARGAVLIERIVGLPGEAWQEQKGRVYIDKELLREPYVTRRDHGTLPRATIPQGSYVVLGDDRSVGCDSRAWGPLPRRDIIARVIATYWPPSQIGLH